MHQRFMEASKSQVLTSSIYISAGQVIKEQTYDTLWRLNLECIPILLSNDAERISSNNHQWEQVNQRGTPPGKISHHTLVSHGDYLYLYGGSTEDKENENMYRLNMSSH